MIDVKNYHRICDELRPFNASLIAVSKTKPAEAIIELQKLGQKMFGENYVQELLEKNKVVQNADWHFIGHLQSNKVKSILPVVSLIHGVDSIKLLNEINRQALKENLTVNCLLQVYIAKEETKFGLAEEEVISFMENDQYAELKNIKIKGLMGMASNTEDNDLIRSEFRSLRKLFDRYKSTGFDSLSMGMSSDYMIALEEGSNMIRIGSAIFGMRNYSQKI